MISAEELTGAALWARVLPADELERARRGVIVRAYARGAYLCHRGDVLDGWTGVMSGLLKLGSTLSTGKSVTYAGLAPGMWFGEGSLLKNEPRRYEVIALRESRIAIMNRRTFDWLTASSVAFNGFLVRQFNERLGQFIALVEHDRTLEAVSRTARNVAWLVNPALTAMDVSRIEISQEELALLCGLSRQATNGALKKLEAEGLLVVERSGLRILDRASLSTHGD